MKKVTVYNVTFHAPQSFKEAVDMFGEDRCFYMILTDLVRRARGYKTAAGKDPADTSWMPVSNPNTIYRGLNYILNNNNNEIQETEHEDIRG